MTKAEERVLADCRAYAESKGLRLNSDEKVLKALIAALARNEREKGKRYCPCRVLGGKQSEDEKIVCPCAFHLKELREQGRCKCRLFFKK